MSTVRFMFPKVRLAEILRAPGGLTVAEALENAQSNLETLKPTCHAELMSLLETAEAAFERLGDGFDDAGMADLYSIGVRGIGTGAVCGAPRVDEALTSLCDLLDDLRSSSRFDREAVGVHVRAWRLLMNLDLPDAGGAAVLEGLQKVSARYAPASQQPDAGG